MYCLQVLYNLLLSLSGGAYRDDSAVTVTIDTTSVLHVVDERYLSLSLSPRLLSNSSVHQLFKTKRFSSLLGGLSPCYLRAGGTAGQYITFNSSHHQPEAVPSDIPAALQLNNNSYLGDNDTLHQKRWPATLYGDQWDFINNMARSNGAHLLYQINDMKRSGAHWDPTNFLELLDFSINKSYVPNLGFEFGNEPNAYRKNFNVTMDGAGHAKEFIQAAQILREQSPYKEKFKSSLLCGPDTTAPSKQRVLKYLTDFLKVAGSTVDKITWHEYNLKGKSTEPIGKENFTDPAVLDKVKLEIDLIKDAIKEAGVTDKKIWLGETGSASGGGVPGYSNRFIAGFMWLDKLGLAAVNGIDVVVRQTLYTYDNHYALIYHDLDPYPDYWLTYMYKRFVGQRVLNVRVSDHEGKVRCYASDLRRSLNLNKNVSQPLEEITLYCMNMRAHNVSLTLDITHSVQRINAYVLQADGPDGLQARYTSLNGVRLEMTSDDRLPELRPVQLDPRDPMTLPSYCMAFYTMRLQINETAS